MPVAVRQQADQPAGVASLVLTPDRGLDAGTLEVRISAQSGGPPKHLDPSQSGAAAWAPAERWFRGASAEAGDGALTVDLGPAATWHLKPFQPYAVAFRDGTGKTAEDRMIWIDMRLPSDPPPPAAESGPASAGYPERPEPAPEAEPEAEAEPEPDDALEGFAEMEDAPEQTPATPEKTGGNRALVLALAGLLLAAVVAGAVWFLMQDDETSVAEPEAPAEEAAPAPAAPAPQPEIAAVPLTLDGARAFLLEQKPEAGRALDEAERFAGAGEHQAAFLIRKYAAQQGSGAAALQMARSYDPATHDPSAGVIAEADPATAATWYEQAAKAGEVAAMERLGEMLKTGLLDRPDAPEQAVFWLRKAAEAGSERATELLQ